jgi:hypothetical protein
MEPHVWQRDLICIAQRKENQRAIRAFLESVTKNQMSFIDQGTGILIEMNRIPV